MVSFSGVLYRTTNIMSQGAKSTFNKKPSIRTNFTEGHDQTATDMSHEEYHNLWKEKLITFDQPTIRTQCTEGDDQTPIGDDHKDYKDAWKWAAKSNFGSKKEASFTDMAILNHRFGTQHTELLNPPARHHRHFISPIFTSSFLGNQ